MAVGAGLAAVGDLEGDPGWTLSLLAAGFLWQAVAVIGLEISGRRAGGSGLGAVLGPVLLVALLVRLPLLALPPSLSDDSLRYLWDGRVAAVGENPWRLAPDDPELEPLRDERWRRLPHRDVATVYPPLAVGLFSIAAAAPRPVLTLKAALTGADLAACALLLVLARRRGVPEARAAWYAWSPLAALETAGMGHVDALGVAAAVAAVAALSGRRLAAGGRATARSVNAALAAAAGVLAKLMPLAALPMWARQSGRPGRFAAVALAVVALGLGPVALASGGVPPGLLTYGVAWEFNGPLHEPLQRAIDGLDLDRAAHATLDAAKRWTDLHAPFNLLYPWLYPELMAKLLLAAVAVAVVAGSLRARDPVAGSRDLFGALLLCSATVYPWYALWVLPFAALTRAVPWLALAALLPLAYLPRMVPGVELFPWVWLAIWGPFALLFVLHPTGLRSIVGRSIVGRRPRTAPGGRDG